MGELDLEKTASFKHASNASSNASSNDSQSGSSNSDAARLAEMGYTGSEPEFLYSVAGRHCVLHVQFLVRYLCLDDHWYQLRWNGTDHLWLAVDYLDLAGRGCFAF